MHSNREIMLHAVKCACQTLKLAAPELRADREIILAAVEQDGHLLHLAAEHLYGDSEVVLRAAETEVNAGRPERFVFALAAKQLYSDYDFLFHAVKLDARVLMKAPSGYKEDRLFMLKCVEQNYQAAQFMSMELR